MATVQRVAILLSVVLVALIGAGCDVLSSCAPPVPQGIDRALVTIDRAINTIQNEPELWRATLQDVADQLPSDVQSTIRTEIDQLATRSIATAGVELRCNTDFFAERAVQGLKRVKAMLTGTNPPPIPPAICNIVPPKLDLNLSPDRRTTIEIYGYDLDYEAENGHLLEVFLVAKNGERTPLADVQRLGRTTHYLHVLNVAGSDFDSLLQKEGIAKIEFAWGNDGRKGEVIVIGREAQHNNETFTPQQISHVPSHVRGDADFDSDYGNPMSFTVKAQSRVNGNEIQVRVYMYAAEEEDDYTTVDSWSSWERAYLAPAGWTIESYSPSAVAERSGNITDHNIRVESLPAGELVNRFEIYGDTDDDEAGGYTRVIAYFSPMRVNLIESDDGLLLRGEILAKWRALGGEESEIGHVTTNEFVLPDGVGRANHFQYGSIYTHPDTGAHEVRGAIRDKWAELGWELSEIGYPTTDEFGLPDGIGRANHFQSGSIYFHPDTGAHEVRGAIREKWAELGWERSEVGYPTTDEFGLPDGIGRANHFQYGSIYFHPGTGAHEVRGAIREKWAELGWERSRLGYPTSDEQAAPGGTGRISYFQHGSIYWDSSVGAVVTFD